MEKSNSDIIQHKLRVDGKRWECAQPLTLSFFRVSGHSLILGGTVFAPGHSELIVKIEGDPTGNSSVPPNSLKGHISDKAWAAFDKVGKIHDLGDRIAHVFFEHAKKPHVRISYGRNGQNIDYNTVRGVKMSMTGKPSNDNVCWRRLSCAPPLGL